MCNHSHAGSTVPKKKDGIGYKIFRCYQGELLPLVYSQAYSRQYDGMIEWKKEANIGTYECGFCCFDSLKEASDVFLSWNHDPFPKRGNDGQIHKIEYFDAFARHIEDSMCARIYFYPGGPKKGFRTILVKKFRILEEVGPIEPVAWTKRIF